MASDALQLRFSADYFATDGYQQIAIISPAAPNSIKNGQGPASSHNSNMRLQGYFKASQDTNGFFRAGYHTMSDLSSGYSFATNIIQETDLAAGTTTRLDDRSKVDVNFFYENTGFNKQNGSTSTSASNGIPANTPYINANYKDPYSTVGASAQYTKDLTGIVDQYVVAIDARNISGSNRTNNLLNNGSSSAVNYQGSANILWFDGSDQIKSRIFTARDNIGSSYRSVEQSTPITIMVDLTVPILFIKTFQVKARRN